jgi:hypothetical protein
MGAANRGAPAPLGPIQREWHVNFVWCLLAVLYLAAADAQAGLR